MHYLILRKQLFQATFNLYLSLDGRDQVAQPYRKTDRQLLQRAAMLALQALY